MPHISIIVPIYNVEKYIIRCIESILNQTYRDFELILVNDGSLDGCGEICDNYAKEDKRIKVIHKENGGLADARNTGLDLATGDYVGFVDGDDYIENDMYEKLISACKHYKAKISMCGRYDIIEGRITKSFFFDEHKIWTAKEAVENSLTLSNIDSSACDKLFEKQLFYNYRFPYGKYNEDIYIMTHILSEAVRVVHIGECKYYYEHRENSITTESFSSKKMDVVDASKIVLDFVCIKYPDLVPKAKSLYFFVIINLLTSLQMNCSKRKYKQEYIALLKLVRVNILAILTNRYIDKRRKIICFLMATKTYTILNKLDSLKKIIAKTRLWRGRGKA